MLKLRLSRLWLLLAAMLFAPAFTAIAASTAASNTVQTLEWTDLLPEADLKALEAMPAVSHDGGEGPAPSLKQNLQPGDPGWSNALQSANVVGALNGKKIKLPGFVVPIEYDAEQNVTAFFLVPYFGACIHVPPPPPNQIVFVSGVKGLKADMIYNPFWVEGTLSTESISHDLANSAYMLKADAVTEYTYE